MKYFTLLYLFSRTALPSQSQLNVVIGHLSDSSKTFQKCSSSCILVVSGLQSSKYSHKLVKSAIGKIKIGKIKDRKTKRQKTMKRQLSSNKLCSSVGGGKPNWTMILDSCRAELVLLETDGIRINGKVFKIHIASVMGDTVAKNEMCGMRGVGAYNNCSVCRADVWAFLS